MILLEMFFDNMSVCFIRDNDCIGVLSTTYGRSMYNKNEHAFYKSDLWSQGGLLPEVYWAWKLDVPASREHI